MNRFYLCIPLKIILYLMPTQGESTFENELCQTILKTLQILRSLENSSFHKACQYCSLDLATLMGSSHCPSISHGSSYFGCYPRIYFFTLKSVFELVSILILGCMVCSKRRFISDTWHYLALLLASCVVSYLFT